MAIKYAVIIPAYKAHDTIRRALDSIYVQTRSSQVKVFLINDCDPTGNYQYLIPQYQNKINLAIYKTQQNGGPTAARNLGIEKVIQCGIPYILFMDADDCFYSPLTIHYFHEKLLIKNYDFICGNFIEQMKHKEQYYYKIHEDKHVWLFAKLYKTRLIRDNNIRFFHPSQNEDVGFNLNYSMYTDSSQLINETLYMWKWDSNSITRSNDGEYSQYCIVGLYQNCLQVYNKLSKDYRLGKDRYMTKVAERMIMMYVDWNSHYEDWKPQVTIKLFEYMREFYFRFYKPIEKNYTKRQLLTCGKGIFKDDLEKTAKMSFIDFLKKLNSSSYKDLYY